VTALRLHLSRHPLLAAWIIAAALLMRVLVPAGFMPGVSGGAIMVQLCSGDSAQHIEIALPVDRAPASQHDHHDKAQAPCAFSALSTSTLSGTDPALLALALFFILALAVRVTTMPARKATAYLRPPLRGPPVSA
jgi:hypothetical protein